ncbi:Pseudouridine synthase family protein [Prunus dulcis]|uniref:tRNA pseudouridine(55) synthase n=1 Tax=Prunus dulcis TaxID=3755 RepID=A0A4Y1QSC5_PRUDU|nr:Pseudouridine synthase family protein [Prunus dulcis]
MSDVALYALGIGACARDAVDVDQLKFVYHDKGQKFIQVLPTFAALFSLGSLPGGLGLPGLKYDPRLLLHGQQYIELYKPLPSNACLKNTVSLAGLHDKGKAAVLEIETKSYDKDSGALLCMNRTTAFLRGAGGFSKSSHPYSYSNYPKDKVPSVKTPKGQPFVALLYRLSGDYNPLHSDPTFAKVAGGDPNLVKCISGRFLLHVYPGETLLTEMWLEGLRVIYQTKVKERSRTVLSGYVDLHGLFEMPSDTEEASQPTVNGDNVRALCDVVRELPIRAVIDLLSIGVCTRCILRLFGIREHVYYRSSLSPSMLSSVLGDSTCSEKHMVDGNFRELFTYWEDKKLVTEKESANELAVSISSLIRQQGFEIDSFSLEVSIPPIVLENDHTVVYEKKGCKSNMSAFRIRLTYTHRISSKTVENSVEGCHGGAGNGLNTIDDDIKCSGPPIEAGAVVEGSFVSLQANESSECLKLPLGQSNEPCCLEFLCYRTQIYVGGRYLKYSRNVSQTCWIIDDERMGEASVEEILGSNILPLCRGDNYKFHAAGREDIDVRMLGSGRPFLLEIQNARYIPSEESVKFLETKINNLEKKLVGVKNLKLVGSQSWELMREGEAEKQKQYTALVWISRPLKDEDLQSISSLEDMRTPIRVLHRRSPLEPQAGTYIKEFIHGDLGRTQPRYKYIFLLLVE